MKQIFKTHSFISICLLQITLVYFMSSCDKDSSVGNGKNTLIINQVKTGYINSIARLASNPQTRVVDLGNGLKLLGTLSTDQTLTRAAGVPTQLADNVQYRILIYNEDGSFAKDIEFSRGNETDIPLDPGTYKYVAYSINSSTSLPDYTGSTFDDLQISTSNNKDLMIDCQEFEIQEESATTLNLILHHQFSFVQVKIDTSEIGQNIESMSGMTIDNHSPNASWAANTNSITFGGTPTSSSIDWTDVTMDLQNITSNGSVIYSNTASSESSINISSLTIGSKTLNDIVVSGFSVVPKTKYLFTLKIVESGTTPTEPTDYYIPIDNKNSNKTVGWSSTPNIDLEDWTFTSDANAGFQLDITSLDNSFDLIVNNKPIYVGTYTEGTNVRTTNEINFQGWEGELGSDNTPVGTMDPVVHENDIYYPPNILFNDGVKWGANGGAQYIWNFMGAAGTTPIIRVIVDYKGKVTMYGRKFVNNINMEPLALAKNYDYRLKEADNNIHTITVDGSFNDVDWFTDKENKVSLKMFHFPSTSRFYGSGFGRKFVEGSTEGAISIDPTK